MDNEAINANALKYFGTKFASKPIQVWIYSLNESGSCIQNCNKLQSLSML